VALVLGSGGLSLCDSFGNDLSIYTMAPKTFNQSIYLGVFQLG